MYAVMKSCKIALRFHLLFHSSSYLHVTGEQYGRPISGQREVVGYYTHDPGNLWKAAVSFSEIYRNSNVQILHPKSVRIPPLSAS